LIWDNDRQIVAAQGDWRGSDVECFVPDRTFREEELAQRLGWLVSLRWLFLLGLIVAPLCGNYLLGLGFPTQRILLAAATILLYNLGFTLIHGRQKSRGKPELATSRLEARTQIYLDACLLTVLIHLTGGIESPFPLFYLFHAIIAAMLLSRAEAVVFGVSSACLYLATVALEYAELLPHYHLQHLYETSKHQNLTYILIVAGALLFILALTIYMTTSIVGSLHTREKELVAARRMIEAKSTDLEDANARLIEHQRQLVQAEKLASLGQLVAGIAHEVNNPIQFIYGNMQIITEAMADILPIVDAHAAQHDDFLVARLNYRFFREQVDQLMADMSDGAVRIRDIVKDLKTFARRDEGEMAEEVDLNAVVKTALRLLHNKIKHFEMQEHLAGDLPAIRGNTNRLQQVVVNTLLNAADALTHTQGGTINVASHWQRETGEVDLVIADNGCGMSDEVRSRIFDPFFTTKQRTGGTGLGLAIVYGIIEQHGGHIDVESRKDRGTTFRYILPIARKPEHR